MSNRSTGLSEPLYDYLLQSSLREHEVLRELRHATETQSMPQMRSAPEQGQFMALLIRLMGAKRLIEVGTYTGYATLWMALALPEEGEIISCDISEGWTDLARKHWQKAGVADRITLKLAPAAETLKLLVDDGGSASFDLAFIDADKENYDAYFELCLQLIRPGGLILVDNVLWGGSVIDSDNNDAATRAIRSFNEKRNSDDRVELSMLPVADGLTLLLKR